MIVVEHLLDPAHPLQLHVNRYGKNGPPIVILHGLLGSSRNWHSVAQSLAHEFSVFAVDLRNHGQSPHSQGMGYPDLAADVRAMIRQRGLGRVHLVGHSLGGKVAMTVALSSPDLLRSLTVVDIAPVRYRDGYTAILRSLETVRLTSSVSRREIDDQLAASIPDPGLRQFLLTNLVSSPDGYRWRVNLDVLQRALPSLSSFPAFEPDARFAKPTLFMAGVRSNYVGPHHHSLIRHRFPAARFLTLDRAGHWPHVDNPEDFVSNLSAFLRDSGDQA